MPAREASRITGPEVILSLTGTSDAPRSCLLLGIERGEMHIRAERWIEPGSLVGAKFARLNLSGEVLYCTKKDTWYLICVALSSGEYRSRRDPRLAIRQPARLSADGSESAQGIILDVSISGMRLRTSHRVEAGTMVFVETSGNLVVGVVRHCRERQADQFDTGIEVTDILSDEASPQSSPGVLKKIRWKLARAISGEPIMISRS